MVIGLTMNAIGNIEISTACRSFSQGDALRKVRSGMIVRAVGCPRLASSLC